MQQNHPQNQSEEEDQGPRHDWDPDEPDPVSIFDTASINAIGTSTASAASSHGTPNTMVEESAGLMVSSPLPPHAASLGNFASRSSSTISMNGFGSRNHFSPTVTEQQHKSENILIDSVDEVTVSRTDQQHLLKIFLEKSSSWVR